MKITNANLIRLAGLSALVGGLCYVFVGVFHPANIPASVTTTRWATVHVMACAMCFFGVLGLAGIYARQAVKAGWLGLVGFVLLSLWLVIIMGFSFVEAFILPQVATATPALVDGWMKIFNGGTSTIDLGVLPTLWTLTGLIYILGGLLFGIATFRARILPRGAAVLLALGTLLAPVGRSALPFRAAEDCHTDGTGPGLAGLRTDDRAASAGSTPHRSRRRRSRMNTSCAVAPKDLARGGYRLRAHVRLDPDARPLQLGQGSELHRRLGGRTRPPSWVACSRSSSPSPASPPRSSCSRSSRSRTSPSLSASWLPASSSPAPFSSGVAFILSIVTLRQDGAGAASADHQPRPRRPVRPHLPARTELHAGGVRPACWGTCCTGRDWCPDDCRSSASSGHPSSSSAISQSCSARSTNTDALAGLSALLVAVFEFSLGIWLIVKGFNPEAVAALESRDSGDGRDRTPSAV